MESIGEYEYSKKDLIGHGAFAVVFKGRHKRNHEHVVAIKCITKKNLAKSQSLLSKEIKILKELSDLHHENVVALLDCKETSNHVYLVMEYCNGGDLADYLQLKGTLSEDTISLFLKQIAGAMKALNAKGIVHRDMKPQNILLTHSGIKTNPPAREIKLKIADFGFARFLQDGVMAATLCGSPMYMAPEVIMSLQYDAKADLWSIGTIVYQCLTGKAPFQAQTPQQLKQFYEKNANLQPNIPTGTTSELKDLLKGMLRRNAKDRIDFDEFFNHPYVNPRPKTSSPVPVPRSRSRSSIGESPNMKTVSASPLSGNMTNASPPHLPTVTPRPPQKIPAPAGQELMETGSPVQEMAGFVKQVPPSPVQRIVTLAEQEDFVLVPENLPAEAAGGSPKRTSVDLNTIFSDPCSDSPPKHTAQTLPKTVRASPYSQAAQQHRGSGPLRQGSPGSPDSSSPQSQTSPSRPSTLPVQSPAGTPTKSSQPIPVPSQVKAYEQIQRSIQGLSPSPSSQSPVAQLAPAGALSASPSSGPSPRRLSLGSTTPVGITIPKRTGSNTSLASVGSMSPPSVQFTIGTPPSTGWKRNVSPGAGGSPHRKPTLPKICTVPVAMAQLPPIVGSPTKVSADLFSPSGKSDDSPTKPLPTPFACGRARSKTCPDYIAAVGYSPEEGCRDLVPMPMERSDGTENMQLEHSSSTGRLSEQLLKAAFGVGQIKSPPMSMPGVTVPVVTHVQTSPGQTMMVPYQSGSNSSLSRNSSNTSLNRQRNMSIGETDPAANMYAQSPPNMEGPISFVAPELAEETLMDKDHNETVAKLNFILALVECIIELAQSRSSPISQSVSEKAGFTLDHVAFMSESQRRLEQLVLYMRALQLLTSSIQLAKDEVHARRLQPSNGVKTILKDMNNYYHQCLLVCKNLHSKGATSSPDSETQTAAVTADKLIYTYAIDMCQTAALDELFGNPQECFRRYRNAQILLHSLAQQAHCDTDRDLLQKYREAVEKRLYNLHSQGYIQAVESSLSN